MEYLTDEKSVIATKLVVFAESTTDAITPTDDTIRLIVVAVTITAATTNKPCPFFPLGVVSRPDTFPEPPWATIDLTTECVWEVGGPGPEADVPSGGGATPTTPCVLTS